MNNLGTISRHEWQRVILLAGIVMLITTIPYMVGWLSAGKNWEFGGFVFGADDGYSYLAKMRLGARGDWLFTIRYTSEPHEGALLFLPYILLGKLTSLFVASNSPNLPTALAITFHLARIIFGFMLILVSYRFVAVFLKRPDSRMLALVLIVLSGGLGWLLAIAGLGHLFGSLPVDFYVPEDYSFLILFGLPHLALSRSAMLVGFLLLFRALQIPEPHRWARWSAAAGLCWIVTGLCVPFYIAVTYLVLGCWGLAAWIHRRRFPWALFWRAAGAALVASPVLIYSTVVFATNDVLGRWSSQNQLPSPNPLHYVLGYIVLALPAIVGLRWAWRKGSSENRKAVHPREHKEHRERQGESERRTGFSSLWGGGFAMNSSSENGLPYLLLAAWVVVMPVVVYLPINVQRRLAEGVIVPLCILAVAGLRLVFPHRRQWRRARTALLLLVLPTSILLWLGGTFNALSPARPLFHPKNELAAMDTLNQIAPRDAVVLSVKETGNYLPARTDLVAYVGLGPETLDEPEKEKQAEDFFAGKLDDTERHALLKNVDYIFYGLLEHDLSGTAEPAWAEGLSLLPPFKPGDPVVVYEVPHD